MSLPDDQETENQEASNPNFDTDLLQSNANVIRFPIERREREAVDQEVVLTAEKQSAEKVSVPHAEKAKIIRLEGPATKDESYMASLLPLVNPSALDEENQSLRERLMNLTNRLHQVLKKQPVIANVLAEWEWQYFVEPDQLRHPWGIYHTQEKLPAAYALLPFEFIRCITLFDEIERINALLNRIGLLLSLPSRKENKQRRYELAVRGSWLYALKQRLLKDLDQAEIALYERYEPIWKKWRQGVQETIQETVRTLIYKQDLNR